MRGEWATWRNGLTADECERVVRDAENLPIVAGVVGTAHSTRIDTAIRKSKVKWIRRNDPKFEWLFDKLWLMALRVNSDWFGFHIDHLESIQLSEYEANDAAQYKDHIDCFWWSKKHRKLSCTVQLTDGADYDGGDFQLTTQGPALPSDLREQGTLIFFSGIQNHRVLPVTRGVRRSLVCWFEGPHWV